MTVGTGRHYAGKYNREAAARESPARECRVIVNYLPRLDMRTHRVPYGRHVEN